MATLSIVVPCYNEEEVLSETIKRLSSVLDEMVGKGKVVNSSHVCFVDDGSCDRTWSLIKEYAASNPYVRGIKLSRNRGHQIALLAGLSSVEGDMIVSIDADLQDDVSVIEEMVDKYQDGYDIVYGVRASRDTDTWFKRTTGQGYYKVLQAFGVELVYNHADYRLLSRRAMDSLKKYEEVNLFLRGIIPTIGYPSTTVEYAREERFAGESKYPLRKMLALAVDGITSFSSVPLRVISGIGILVFSGSLVMSLWVLWVKLISDAAIPGWASSVLPMYFLGGIQLLGIGVVGEYVSKIYMESKRRPRFFIEEKVSKGGD